MIHLLRRWLAWRRRYGAARKELAAAEARMRQAERKHNMRAVHFARMDVAAATHELLMLETTRPIPRLKWA